jgi:phosphate transport system substrate-binding protein
MKRLLLIGLAIVLAASLSSCAEGGALRGAGGEDNNYSRVTVEEYSSVYRGRAVDIQGGGSSAGYRAAKSGAAGIGMLSRFLTEKEQDVVEFIIAKDGLAMIVHPSNVISNLTLEQIRMIYTAEITNWSQIGGANKKIHIIAREEGSGTRGAFDEMVMHSGEGADFITPKAIIQNSNGAIRQLVANDPASIGFISLGLVNEQVKALSIDGAAASRENVADGSYRLFRPFLFVTDGEPQGNVKDFIDFVMSPRGQAVLEHEGLIPLHEAVSGGGGGYQ